MVLPPASYAQYGAGGAGFSVLLWLKKASHIRMIPTLFAGIHTMSNRLPITEADAERIALMAETLADKVRTARQLPVVETGECVRDGTKIKVTLLVDAPSRTHDEIYREFGQDDKRP